MELTDVNIQALLKKKFGTTEFDQLMQKRIYKVLIVCSNYDNFMLEEDGRIDEQIFNEYVSLNLKYPPVFIRANSSVEAFKKLKKERIDLVITMLNIDDVDAFQLATNIKEKYNEISIVVLTHSSKIISKKIENEDLHAIDYVFCWLGNSEILLSIIKLIEDKMNAPFDVGEKGVQTIILVEDSVRYYSSFLPELYRIFFDQSKLSSTEGVNEHQKTLRMRGRPRILLATNYNEAIELFNKYKDNVLGVISDVRYKVDGIVDKNAGFKLHATIKAADKYIPLLLLSSEDENEAIAKETNIPFINKYSKNLTYEIKNYLIDNLSLGSFSFYSPKLNVIIDKANNLKSFQELILTVPDDSLEYHFKRNDVSKWLNARGLFQLARRFKQISNESFKNDIDKARFFVYEMIANYRAYKTRGVISKFKRNSFDSYASFSRIGNGSIGGKARGLAFVDSIIKKKHLRNKYENVIISIPKTLVLCADIFDEFIESNDLYKIGLSENSNEEILNSFVQAKLPKRIINDLYSFVEFSSEAIAIRSSSKLEDSYYQPFAGVYSTYMIANNKKSVQETVSNLADAIKSVYASVFYRTSKSYMDATSNVIDEEKMGVILQEVCGTKYGTRFYPSISGVARSSNFYPIYPETVEDGVANIAFGLGKHIVEGGKSIRFSPKYPKKNIQLSSPEYALRNTQNHFFALNLDHGKFIASVDDGVNILRLRIKEAEKDNSLRNIASTFDLKNNVIREGLHYEGKKIITFSNILKHDVFPLAKILEDILQIGKREMNNNIEIEFAIKLNAGLNIPVEFNLLQIRPIIDTDQNLKIKLGNVKIEDSIIQSNSALGNGIYKDLYDIIYVKPESFDPAKNRDIALEIENLNIEFSSKNKNYILVGPGRWGSSDPWLGIPVTWSQISAASIIVESGLKNYQIDPSQGTHFFQNLTSFRVGYFTVNPFINDGFYDLEYLNNQEPEYESTYLRHIKFKEKIIVKIDGKHNKGIVYKSGIIE